MATTNPHKGRTGLDRIVRAAGYSWAGLRKAYTGESAFRQETWLAVVLLPCAWGLGRTWVEVALLAGSVLGVLIGGGRSRGVRAARVGGARQGHRQCGGIAVPAGVCGRLGRRVVATFAGSLK